MAQKFPFNPTQTNLLIKAAAEAKKLYKSVKSAATKAFMTEEESAAYAMEGYADEAIVFLKNPIAATKADAERSDQDGDGDGEKRAITELMFNHKVALRTGLLAMIAEAEDNIEEQQATFFADPSGMEQRLKDLRKLEWRLRGQTAEQTELPDEPDAVETAEADADVSAEEAPPEDQGPFDAPPVPAPLALPPGPRDPLTNDLPDDIPEADFEILGAIDGAAMPSDEDLALMAQPDGDALEQAIAEPERAVATIEPESTDALVDPMTEDEREAWLAEPLRRDPAADEATSAE